MPLPTPAVGARITAAQLQALLPVPANKITDTSVNSTTAFNNDPDLFVAVAANAVYEIFQYTIYTQGTVGQMVFGFTGPTSATLDWSVYGLATTVTASDTGSISTQARNIGTVKTIGGSTTDCTAWIHGRLVTSVTAGTLQFKWGPSAVSATPNVLRAGSFLVARQIA